MCPYFNAYCRGFSQPSQRVGRGCGRRLAMGSGRVCARRASRGVRGLPRRSLSIYLSLKATLPRERLVGGKRPSLHAASTTRVARLHSVTHRCTYLRCWCGPRACPSGCQWSTQSRCSSSRRTRRPPPPPPPATSHQRRRRAASPAQAPTGLRWTRTRTARSRRRHQRLALRGKRSH